MTRAAAAKQAQHYDHAIAVISEQQLCENIDEIMHEVENGATYDISVSGRAVARITPITSDGPQEVVDPVIVRRIGSMSPAASAAWKKDIAAAIGEDVNDERSREGQNQMILLDTCILIDSAELVDEPSSISIMSLVELESGLTDPSDPMEYARRRDSSGALRPDRRGRERCGP